MSKVQCFKIKKGTTYDSEVKKHFMLLPKWNDVFEKVGELLDENITRMAYSKDYLVVDTNELTKEENKTLFKKDGYLKSSTKKAKSVFNKYHEIIDEVGLSGYMELREINFIYGVMRRNGQNLESFRTSENDIYFKADFDLEKVSNGMVEAITEIQYQEKYLGELKKQKQTTTQ